ncbi:MAG: 3'(2'),5'-bisphosphate nucleotidase CysQ [Pseudomonadota bacterium]
MDDITAAELVRLAEAAGEKILEIYDTDFEVDHKEDESPLTKADLAAHEVLQAGLKQLTPDIPILSEESVPPSFEVRKTWSSYWLVDPLDGTKEFVNRNGEFTVNLALIRDGAPAIGVVGVPVQQQVYFGDVGRGLAVRFERRGQDLDEAPLHTRTMQDRNTLKVVASRSHGGAELETFFAGLAEKYPEIERTSVGSSLKLCILAAGEADLYPRIGPTSEWDIAAAHAVLTAAGGEVFTGTGAPLRYNGKASLLNPDFVAVADSRFDWLAQLPEISTTVR